MKIIEKRANGTTRVYTKNDEPSLTDQSWAKDCDVNNIIAKYIKTGQISHLAKHQGQYADVSAIPDLQSALDQVTKAQQAFDDLPSNLRKRFGNSPVEMVNFLSDPKNDQEAISLGLKVKKLAPETPVPGENKTKGRVSPKKQLDLSNDEQNQTTD